jgi:hypothetical protein
MRGAETKNGRGKKERERKGGCSSLAEREPVQLGIGVEVYTSSRQSEVSYKLEHIETYIAQEGGKKENFKLKSNRLGLCLESLTDSSNSRRLHHCTA